MSRPRLLLADDSITIQKVVNLTFADEGIDVVTVGDGDAALNHLNQFVPDLVLADVHMPGVGGYELCQRIRENDMTRDIPVVLLVGSFEPFDQEEADRVGANAYLTKPFQSIRQLVTQVTELMNARAGNSEVQEAPVPEAETAQPVPEAAVEPDAVPSTAIGASVIESAAEQIPPAERPDDIENLYAKSIAETVELPSGSQQFQRYSDSGLDDEMIETSYTRSADAGHAGPGVSRTELITEEFQNESGAGVDATPETAGFERHVSAPETFERESGGGVETEPLTGDFENHVSAPEIIEPRPEPSAASEPAAEQTAALESNFQQEFDRGAEVRDTLHIETAADVAALEPESRSIPVEENVEHVSQTKVDIERSPWGTPLAAETVRLGPLPSIQTSPDVEFNEVDLLELPPIAEGSTYRLTTPADAVESGSTTQVVSLSPQLIDLIVQKVVEKLSEKY